MPVTREEVIHGFRLILGRDPGDEAAIAAHMKIRDATELAAVLLRSPEFARGTRFKDFLTVRGRDDRDREVTMPHESRAKLRVILIGNCQVATVGSLMQAMAGDVVAQAIESTPSWLARVESGELDLAPVLRDADLVYVQLIGTVVDRIRERFPAHAGKLRLFMPLNFTAFHPDCVYVTTPEGGHLQGPMGDYHSSIAFWACRQGWSEKDALALFRPEVYDLLGFADHEASSREVLLQFGELAGLALEPLLHGWMRGGVWMHTTNHPKVHALADLAAELLRREGIDPMVPLGALVEDSLAHFPVWPVYPPIAARYGVEGSYLFKIDRGSCPPSQPHIALSLADFVSASFARYREVGVERLACPRIEGPAYARLAAFKPAKLARLWGRAAAPAEANESLWVPTHPYADLPDHHFWRRMMEDKPLSQVDPVAPAPWRISTEDKVATAGSCFAQHISRTLRRHGFRFFVTEPGKGLPPAERLARQFGVYSARYGNVYTGRQLVQLVDRAYGRFAPLDKAWKRPDGRWVDPFRPQVEPAGFDSPQAVAAEREAHLGAVRRLFEESDVFIFTLGLTEAWRRTEDGAVFPLAPGVVAGRYDPASYAFVNFGVGEVLQDIRDAVRRLRAVNPDLRFIFTVSPVPLIATYEDRHVLVSTVESKSVLRAAIAEASAADPGIVYFPSYEVVTGPHTRGKYFEKDLRTVSDRGVQHVMRLFLRHYAQAPSDAAAGPAPHAGRPPAHPSPELVAEQRRLSDVVCDEEAIDRHRRAAG
jgi:hypothetical protein